MTISHLATKPRLRLVERTFGSPEFIARDRNPNLPSPTKFIRVSKAPGSFEMIGGKMVEVRA
jgi:hypothetical protein